MNRFAVCFAVLTIASQPTFASNSGLIGAAGNFDVQTSASFLQPGALVASDDRAIAVTAGSEYKTRVPYTPLLHPSGNWSVEIWLKPSFVPGGFSCPFSSGHFNEPRSGWLIYMEGTQGWSFRGYQNIGLGTAFQIDTVGMPPQANTWYHIAGTWESGTGTARLYVNGVEVGSQKGVTNFVPTSDAAATKGDLHIGSRSDGPFQWNGSADEAAIYAVTLSAADVLEHYQNAISLSPSRPYHELILEKQPLGYWRFNQESFDPSLTPENTNTAPTVVIKSATMRGATGLMDVVFRVNDPDDATVKTRALAFIDGQRSFAKVIKPTTFAEDTGAKLGDTIASNTDHTLTWNVATDWNISLGQIKFEILAMDGRGLLPLNWVTIPAANGQPELTISKNAPTDQEVLDALFWQYASGDPGLVVEDGFLVGTAASGALDGVDLVSGTTVEAYASTWVMKSMNLALADIAQVNYAIEARSGVTNNSRWHALKAPYQPIDVVVRWDSKYDFNSGTLIEPRVKSGIPAGLPHIRSISNGYPTLVLRENGTVFSFGAPSPLAPPQNLVNVTAIASGYDFGIALKSDGTVVAWGANNRGQTDVPTGLANVTAIAAGYSHSLALKSDGTVVAWGSNESGQTTVPTGLSGVVSITASDVSLAVKADGTVIGWGAPDWYLTQFSELQNIKQITNNSDGFIALKSDGTVVSRYTYQPPLGLNSVTFVDGSQYGGYALKADGTVVGWGDELFEPVLIPDNLRGVNALDFGYGLVLALKKAPRQP